MHISNMFKSICMYNNPPPLVVGYIKKGGLLTVIFVCRLGLFVVTVQSVPRTRNLMFSAAQCVLNLKGPPTRSSLMFYFLF